MRDLLQTTLIIPIKIEHPDRYRNAYYVLNFLNRHFKTNVFIYEISSDGISKIDFIKSLTNLDVKHQVFKEENYFHRTKYLNVMLDNVTTPVVANYDIDVILPPEFYLKCQEMILDKSCDVVYPYKFGSGGQVRVLENFKYIDFRDSNYEMSCIDNSGCINNYDSEYGHCIFFSTEIYKKYGAENENFISYGPEDKERGERFKKMGFSVKWLDECKVYHFEHHRGVDSSDRNPYSQSNWGVFYECQRMDRDQIIEYYKNQTYNQKYKTIGKW